MNKLLLIDKKLVLLLLFTLSIFLVLLIIFNQLTFNKNTLEIKKDNYTYSYDIKNPKFTINGNDEVISIKAQGASFLTTDEVLLQNNVIFKSNNFIIKSPEVYFNRANQTAYSIRDSIFISKKTSINAKGFKITDKGNTIKFNGKTLVLLIE